LENGNTWYYAILAEGGTGYGHRISVARSRTLFGNYEESPYNPVMTQTDTHSAIQRCGHGKPVQASDGSWWMFYLCARPARDSENNMYTVLGRETALDPIEFTKDGWFTVNAGKGPGIIQNAPDINFRNDPKTKYKNPYKLKNFQFARNPDKKHYNFRSWPFKYTLYLQPGELFEKTARNTLLMREKSLKTEFSVVLNFKSKIPGSQAGLTSYYSTTTYISFSIRIDSQKKRILVLSANSGTGEKIITQIKDIPDGKIFLKIKTDGLNRTFYAASAKNKSSIFFEKNVFTPFLSDEGNRLERKRHTGTLTGMYGNIPETQKFAKAIFTCFDEKLL
jgi:xylan 1,4-beta-xylosidase